MQICARMCKISLEQLLIISKSWCFLPLFPRKSAQSAKSLCQTYVLPLFMNDTLLTIPNTFPTATGNICRWPNQINPPRSSAILQDPWGIRKEQAAFRSFRFSWIQPSRHFCKERCACWSVALAFGVLQLSFHVHSLTYASRGTVRPLFDIFLFLLSFLTLSIIFFYYSIKRYSSFKAFSKRILVATDIFGRGIDMERVNVVINYDMPDSPDSYLHRVRLFVLFFLHCLASSLLTLQLNIGRSCWSFWNQGSCYFFCG